MQAVLHAAQRDALQKMGVANRLKLNATLWEHARALKVAALRAQHADWDQEQIRRAAQEALQRASR